jgi:hypothetical protein
LRRPRRPMNLGAVTARGHRGADLCGPRVVSSLKYIYRDR